jgi:hypothetical protein
MRTRLRRRITKRPSSIFIHLILVQCAIKSQSLLSVWRKKSKQPTKPRHQPLQQPSQAERESSTLATHRPHHSSHISHNSRNHLPSLSAYAILRSYLRGKDDHYSHHTKHQHTPTPLLPPRQLSRMNDCPPNARPHSPRTLAHSPPLRPYASGYDLPTIRNFAPQHTCSRAHRAPTPRRAIPRATRTPSTGLTISDITSRTNGTQRKLPCPSSSSGGCAGFAKR